MKFSEEDSQRYSRQMVIPEVGKHGQEKLRASRVLLVGVGGLGSPAAFYLAAAGVGTLGLIDSDEVSISNLQRQILHQHHNLGKKKVDSARQTLHRLNPGVEIETYPHWIDVGNAREIISQYHLVVDGTDNLPTRFLVNDACVMLKKPFIYGSVMRFEGQSSVFAPPRSGCYRCLFKELPPPGSVPGCQETGVIGVAPGIIGLVEATEAMKLLLEIGEPLLNRLLIYDGLQMNFLEVNFFRDPACLVCGDNPTITSLEEANYQEKNTE